MLWIDQNKIIKIRTAATAISNNRIIPSTLRVRMMPRMSNSVVTSQLQGSIDRVKIKKIFDSDSTKGIIGQTISVKGWVKTVRDQKKFAFIEVNDGSCITGIQAVVDCSIPSFGEVSKLSTGAAVEVIGTVIESIGKGQKYEIKADSIRLVGDCPSDYPLQKKRHTQEFLRTLAHLRPRTNTISAASRVRSALAFGTHDFFQREGFVYLQSPLITASDCEGAGEMFRVTTLPIENPSAIPLIKNTTETDFSQDFFSKPAYLTVSGQLSGEAYACALGDIYTF
eukprot:gene5703-11509_t